MTRSALRLLATANLAAYLAVVAVNALANILPIAGRNTGEISDGLPNYFVPAGLTFSVWGVIYLLLGAWAAWQFVGALRGGAAAAEAIGRVGPWFLVSSAANIGWILAWHHGRYPATLLLMLVILGALIAAYLRLDVGRAALSAGRRVVSHWPFSVYLGWITVATVANVTALLVSVGWDGFGVPGPAWALIVIGAAAGITLAVLATRRDAGYALTVLWALAGIAIARGRGPMASRAVMIGAIVAGCLVALGILGALALPRKA